MIYIKLLLISMALFLAACDVDNSSTSSGDSSNTATSTSVDEACPAGLPEHSDCTIADQADCLCVLPYDTGTSQLEDTPD